MARLSTNIFKLRRNLVASYPILVVSLEISTIVVDRICQRESAECVGKQGTHSEWAKGTLLQALSRTEGRNRQAGSRARRGCYSSQVVVSLKLEVGGASTTWRSLKIKVLHILT